MMNSVSQTLSLMCGYSSFACIVLDILICLTNSKDIQRIFKPIVAEIKHLVDNQVKAIKDKYNKEPKVQFWY